MEVIIMNTENIIAPTNPDLNVENYETIDIKNLIYYIRGKAIILDTDVASLYYYETKRINEAVNRNKARFPENFCFQLTKEELKTLKSVFCSNNQDMRSQIATASKRKY